MPTPRKGEKQNKFMSRCVSDIVHEGKDQKQAVAICYSLWSEHEKAEMASEDYIHVEMEEKEPKQILKPLFIAEGIQAVYDLTNDRIVKYMFDKDKFTDEEAQAWIDENSELYEVLAKTLQEMYPKVLFQ
jgi:hypothetical protein